MSNFVVKFDDCKRDQNSAANICFSIISSDGSFQSGIVFASGDVKIIRHTGGTWDTSNVTSLPSEIGATGIYCLPLSATETNPDDNTYPIIIKIDKTILTDTYRGNVSIIVRPDTSNIKQIDEQTTNGNNATLNLKKLSIINTNGDAIALASTNGDNINMYVNGSNKAISIYSEGKIMDATAEDDGIRLYSLQKLFDLYAEDDLIVAYAEGKIADIDSEEDMFDLYSVSNILTAYAEKSFWNIQTIEDAIKILVDTLGNGIKITAKGTDKNAIDLHSDSDGKDISSKELLAISNNSSNTEIIATFIKKILSNKFRKDVPSLGYYTFYDDDNTTPILVIQIVNTVGNIGRNKIS